jgi:hypothetical protein
MPVIEVAFVSKLESFSRLCDNDERKYFVSTHETTCLRKNLPLVFALGSNWSSVEIRATPEKRLEIRLWMGMLRAKAEL